MDVVLVYWNSGEWVAAYCSGLRVAQGHSVDDEFWVDLINEVRPTAARIVWLTPDASARWDRAPEYLDEFGADSFAKERYP